MSGRVKQPPKLLKRLLSQSACSETPERNVNIAQLPTIQLTSGQSRSTTVEGSSKGEKKDVVDAVVEAVSKDPVLSSELNLAVHKLSRDDKPKPGPRGRLVIVTTKEVYYHAPAGYTSRLRLVIESGGSYRIQVLLKVVEEGEVSTKEEIKTVCEKVANPQMKFCPGISFEEYQSFKEVIKYDKKGVCITEEPFRRVSSDKCRLWFPLPLRGYSRECKNSSAVLCRECVALRGQLQAGVRRLSKVTPEARVRHEQANSFYPMKYLSPESLKRRKMNIKQAQLKKKRMIKRYVPKDRILADEQLAEMCQIRSIVENVPTAEHDS